MYKNVITSKKWILTLMIASMFMFSCKKEKDDPTPNIDETKKTQKITFSQKNVEYKNGLVIELKAKSSSSLPVTYTLLSGSGKIDGNKLTVNQEGNFKVKAEQKGNDKFNPATPVEVSFRVVALFKGGVFTPTVGGPREPNQAFVNLRLNKETTAKRDDWDLAFYNGSENRVRVNFSTYMMAKKIDATDLTKVTEQDTVGLKKTVSIGTPNSSKFIDSPDGDLSKTAIGDLTTEGAIYIINRGSKPGTEEIKAGSVGVGSVKRGWKKVKISKTANGYKLEYADIASTTIKSATITKDANYNFTYFSFNTSNTVKVEPEKQSWDLCFTVSSNIYKYGKVLYSYGYSDFILINRYGGTMAKIVATKDRKGNPIAGTKKFEDFKLADAKALTLSSNANGIGSSWRNAIKRLIFNHVYYVVKDSQGNYYKIKFLTLVNNKKERGHPAFKYELLK